MTTNYLKRWREKRGKTQQQLAFDAGVSIDYVRLLEQHPERTAGVTVAEKLARALDVDPDQLFFRPDFGADRIAKLGELYADELVELSAEDRADIIRFVLSAGEDMWRIYRRGRVPWADLLSDASAFAGYLKRFPEYLKKGSLK